MHRAGKKKPRTLVPGLLGFHGIGLDAGGKLNFGYRAKKPAYRVQPLPGKLSSRRNPFRNFILFSILARPIPLDNFRGLNPTPSSLIEMFVRPALQVR